MRWTIKQPDGSKLVIDNPTTDKDIGRAKNVLRKSSRKFNEIFASRGL